MHARFSMRLPDLTRPLPLMAIFLGFMAFKAVGTTYYVDVNSANPTPPYTSWATASMDIQSAVNQTTNGDLVLVNPGVYQSGGYAAPDGKISAVIVTNAITLQSANGACDTSINGTNFSVVNSTIYSMRCIYLGNYAVLSGFTLANGTVYGGSGGGICCASTNSSVSDCLLISNIVSYGYGAGAASGAFSNCTFCGNEQIGPYQGGGVYAAMLDNCTIQNNTANSGGGAANCTLNNCSLYSNFTTAFDEKGSDGGAAYNCTMNNCIIAGNSATSGGYGGGMYGGTAASCIFSNNWATYGGGAASGAQSPPFADLTNCLLIDNSAINNGGFAEGAGAYACQLESCTLQNNSISNNVGQVKMCGGGAEDCTLSNCTLLDNIIVAYVFSGQAIPSSFGGGADSSTLYDSQIYGNTNTGASPNIYGGGVNNCVLRDCIVNSNYCVNYGGGAYDSGLNRCYIVGNDAAAGGGAAECTVYDSLLLGNAAGDGGASYISILMSCTIVSNSELTATYSGEGPHLVGGVLLSTLTNCIVYFNTAIGTNFANYDTNAYGGNRDILAYSCTYPIPGGTGNITNLPDFINPANGNYRLQTNSPCINAGKTSAVTNTVDLDGRPRIVGGTVDMGAYEFQGPGIGEFIAYLQQYGLPTDGSVDFADLDGTPFDVYQDWVAGLNPTNSASVLMMLSPPATNNASGITVSWESVSGINYNLLSATNLTSAFTTIQSNIVGQAGTTSYTDKTATNGGPYFYEVGVQAP
jgi:hypothetical protein